MGSTSKPSDNSRRLAPPSLFVGPPSRNASESALDTRITPLEKQKSKTSSGLAQTQSNDSSSPSTSSSSAASSPESSTKPAPLLPLPARPSLNPRSSSTQSQTHSTRSPNRTNPPLPLSSTTAAPPPRKPSATTATWRALQSTLEEVELSALSGASVFGAEHFHALEDLRNAQVELARAWARGEGDDVNGDADADDVFGEGGQIGSLDGAAGAASAPAVAAAVADKTGAAGVGGVAGLSGGGEETDFKTEKTRLEMETENDIRLARKRRVANDRYFERVNRGVVDVVAKLEAVASKMGGVEMSSQEIWGDEADSDEGSSPLGERT